MLTSVGWMRMLNGSVFQHVGRVFKKSSVRSVILKSIDPEDKRHGGLLVAQALKSHGVEHIFTLIGGHISPILVGAKELGIQVIDTRHEVTAVFAADAYSRLSGTIGVAAVTAGPGVTNTITAVKNAQMAETPLLLIGGAAATLLKGRGALQDIDQLSLFKTVCKHTYSVSCVRDIIPTLRRAVQAAYSATPGPVFVELPLDVLYPYKLVRQEMKIQENPKGLIPKLLNLFLKSYLHWQFAGAFSSLSASPLPVKYPLASDYDIEKCEKLLLQSKQPLFILGSQVMIPPKYALELKEALEVLSIPCYLGGMARGLLGKDNPLHMRQKRREALKEADLVILAGSVCDFRLSYGRIFNKNSKVIAINMDKNQLHKNKGIFWFPTLSVQASPSDFITRLAGRNIKFNFHDDWVQHLKNRDLEVEKQNKSNIKYDDNQLIDPVRFFHHLEEKLPEKALLIVDGGDFAATASYILRPRAPLKWLDPGAFGTLGVGAGFALGAKMCNPDYTVVIIYGDGSCAYSIAELDTFLRHQIPVLAIVGNDACWSQIAREQVPMFDSDVACNLAYSDYHIVAQGFGADGYVINGENSKEVDAILSTAISKVNSSQKPGLVNVHISKSDFRAGSISI